MQRKVKFCKTCRRRVEAIANDPIGCGPLVLGVLFCIVTAGFGLILFLPWCLYVAFKPTKFNCQQCGN